MASSGRTSFLTMTTQRIEKSIELPGTSRDPVDFFIFAEYDQFIRSDLERWFGDSDAVYRNKPIPDTGLGFIASESVLQRECYIESHNHFFIYTSTWRNTSSWSSFTSSFVNFESTQSETEYCSCRPIPIFILENSSVPSFAMISRSPFCPP